MSHSQVVLVQYPTGKANGLARNAWCMAEDKSLEITSIKFGLGCTKIFCSTSREIPSHHFLLFAHKCSSSPFIDAGLQGKRVFVGLVSTVLFVVLICK